MSRPIVLSLLFISCIAGLAACSDDASSPQQDAPKPADPNKPADPTPANTSRFEVEARDSQGASTKAEREIDNSQASQENSGAAIVDSKVMLYLVAPNGTTVSAIITTSPQAQAPGTFRVGQPPEADTHVTWLAPLTGSALSSRGGQIKLTSCPKAVGEKLVGTFEGVTLQSDLGQGDQTLSGSFSVVVYAKNGELSCAPEPKPNDPKPNDPKPTDPNSCDVDYCQDGGTCCPYVQCIASCELRCLTQDPACINPLSPDPVACAQCVLGCPSQCGASDACKSAHSALVACMDRAGCSELEDEDASDACAESSCCAQLQAFY